jgi:hypothetical protein
MAFSSSLRLSSTRIPISGVVRIGSVLREDPLPVRAACWTGRVVLVADPDQVVVGGELLLEHVPERVQSRRRAEHARVLLGEQGVVAGRGQQGGTTWMGGCRSSRASRSANSASSRLLRMPGGADDGGP